MMFISFSRTILHWLIVQVKQRSCFVVKSEMVFKFIELMLVEKTYLTQVCMYVCIHTYIHT